MNLNNLPDELRLAIVSASYDAIETALLKAAGKLRPISTDTLEGFSKAISTAINTSEGKSQEQYVQRKAKALAALAFAGADMLRAAESYAAVVLSRDEQSK